MRDRIAVGVPCAQADTAGGGGGGVNVSAATAGSPRGFPGGARARLTSATFDRTGIGGGGARRWWLVVAVERRRRLLLLQVLRKIMKVLALLLGRLELLVVRGKILPAVAASRAKRRTAAHRGGRGGVAWRSIALGLGKGGDRRRPAA